MATKRSAGMASPIPLEMADAFNRGMCIYVRMGAPGFTAKADPDLVDVGDADKDSITVSKDLLDCPEYDDIKRIHGRIKKFLKTVTLPVPHYFNSFYFIPDPRIDEVNKFLDEIIEEHDQEKVPAFMRVYKQAKEEAKTRLKHLYDEDDYPEPSRLRHAFYIRPKPIEMTVPGRLAEIDPARYRLEQRRLQEEHAKTAMEMRLYLRQSIYAMLRHLQEKLTGNTEDGRAKMIRSSAITHIEEFLAFFEGGGDVTNDTELQHNIQQIKKVMAGLDLDQAKHDDQYRSMMAKSIGGITKAMDKMVVVAPRKIKMKPPATAQEG